LSTQPDATVRLPNNWRCRPYQDDTWRYLNAGGLRAVGVWHRRSGKDDVALNWAAVAMTRRKASYWHMLPEAAQARKAIWRAVDPHTGVRRIDQAFPMEIRRRTLEQEMLIETRWGATWQVLGSDNYNSFVGAPPAGITFSEYALADPNAWAFSRPILAENGGWAVFISTPRGRNHLQRLYAMAKKDPKWHASLLTVRDTGVISGEVIAQERRELAAERGDDEADNIINQEYYCDFDAAIPGSYYGRLIARAEKEGRITEVPFDPRFPVYTAWDLGHHDPTAIWFFQQVGDSTNVIDYYENSGAGADHYARELLQREYPYAGHYLPHDADDAEWGNNGLSRVSSLKTLGIRPCKVLARSSVDDGINAVRILLPRCRFDAKKCERGIDTLRQYQKEWDDEKRCFSLKPKHDWTSHGADAFRYLAQGIRLPKEERPGGRQRTAEM
jgi:phage terminase large subunit